MKQCFFCGYAFDPQMEVFRSTKCGKCGKDVKICKNCKFYKEGVHWDCTETIDEPVREKEASNFCSYFVLKDTGAQREKKPGASDTKNDFNELFKDG